MLKAAKITSVISYPPITSIFVFAALSTKCDDFATGAIVYAVCLLFAVILPFIETMYISVKTNNTDGDIVRKEDRAVPLALGVLCYIGGIIALKLIDAPNEIVVMMICYTAVTAFILLVSFRWKISIHACGLAGPGAILSAVFWPWGLLVFVPIPWICACRYYQKKHTPAQLVAGFACGLAITLAIMYMAGML
ncbi:MAG: hypothetical protein IJ856_06920 [Candidatus Methanomethylophilaceae archaeon]|nr:hypothetical protein [Candidatus Methanomethylophilaceae archaeon]